MRRRNSIRMKETPETPKSKKTSKVNSE